MMTSSGARQVIINSHKGVNNVTNVEDESFKMDKTYDWVEVFMNMFYLAFLIKLGDIFLYCEHSLEIYLYTVAMFLGIYMNKFDMDLYLSKYGFHDAVNKVFLVVYSTGIFVMILNVNATTVKIGNSGELLIEFYQDCHEYRGYVVGFSVGWIMTRGSLLVMHLLVSKTLSDRYILISKVPIIVISLLIVMLNLILRDDTYDDDFSSVKFLLSAALLEYLGFAFWQMYIVGTVLHPYIEHYMAIVKVSIHRQTIRTSAFGVVTLGVSIVELMTPILHSSGVRHYVSLFLGFVIIMSLSMNFFDIIPSKGGEHALTISKLHGTAWMMMQPVVSYCVFGVGMIIKMLLSEDTKDTLHEKESSQTMGIFLGLASLLLMFTRLTHRTRVTMVKDRWVTASCRLVVSIAHILIGFLGHSMDLNGSLAAHAAVCALSVVIDVVKYYRRKDFFYLKTWSSQAREIEADVNEELSEQQGYDSTKIESISECESSSLEQPKVGQTIDVGRNLTETKISLTLPPGAQRIQIPSRYASSSAIMSSGNQQRRVGTHLPRKSYDGKITLPGMSVEKIQLPRKHSEGKITLPRMHSEGKIAVQRSLSTTSYLNHSSSTGAGHKQLKPDKVQLSRRPSDGKISIRRKISGDGKISAKRSASMASYLGGGTGYGKQLNVTRRPSKSEIILTGDGTHIDRNRIKVKMRPSDVSSSRSSSPAPRVNANVVLPKRSKTTSDIAPRIVGHFRPQTSSLSGLSGGVVLKNDKGQYILESMVDTPGGGHVVQRTVLHRVIKKCNREQSKGQNAKSPKVVVVRKVLSSNDVELLNDGKTSDTASVEGLCKNRVPLSSQGSSVILIDDDGNGDEKLSSGTRELTKISRSASLTLSGSKNLQIKENQP